MTQPPNFGGLLIQERARALESSFSEFAQAAWPVLEPTTQFIGGRHIDIISEYLTAVSSGQIKRLLLNLPPRLTKSTLATILFPCWCWSGDQATSRWMFASYSASLSVKHSVDRRTVLTSDWYQKLWPGVQLADDQNEKSQYASTNRGHMLATSIGATATGKGGSVLVIDDPHSVQQALSDVERSSAVRYVRQTLMTRLDDPRSGAIICIMQRLHQSDLTGELLTDGGWEHVCLPAIAEKRTLITLPISGREIIREEGDLLEPQRLSQRTLDDLKLSMGSLAFSGQFMQAPAPTAGNIFKRSAWKRFTILPASATFVIQSWDLAFRDKSDSDFVVGQVWACDGQLAYLVDQVRARMAYVATKQAMRDMHAKWPTSATLVESKANGDAILDELKRELPGLVGLDPEGGKLARAWACTAQVEAGQVFLPEFAPWVEDFLLETAMFPNAQHDDMVDAMTQALNWRRTHGAGGVYAAALATSHGQDTDGVIYDAAAWRARDPGYSNAGWYGRRSIIYVPGVLHPTCFLEIEVAGKTNFVTREFYYDQALAQNALTSVNILQHLFDFTRGLDPLTGVQHRRSCDTDAPVYVPDLEEHKHVRNQLWMMGQYMVVEVSMPPEELMGDIGRISDLLDRKLLRISNECPNTIAQLRNYRLDMRKAMSSSVEQPLDDGRSPCCTALRMHCKQLNIYQLQ